jgi:hypothetical protein
MDETWNTCHVKANAENIWNMYLSIHKGLRTVVTVETIWGQMNYLTYIDYNT